MQKINTQYRNSIVTQILSNELKRAEIEEIENISSYMTITQFGKLNAKKFEKVKKEMSNFFEKEIKLESDLDFEDLWTKFGENFRILSLINYIF